VSIANPSLPKSVWPIWLLAAAVVLALPATSFLYFPLLLRSGVLDPEHDSIGIPMFGSVVAAAMLLPIVLALTYLCVRRYRAGGTLFAWRKDRPLLSTAVSLAFGLPVAMIVISIIQTISLRPSAIELIWVPYALACCVARHPARVRLTREPGRDFRPHLSLNPMAAMFACPWRLLKDEGGTPSPRRGAPKSASLTNLQGQARIIRGI